MIHGKFPHTHGKFNYEDYAYTENFCVSRATILASEKFEKGKQMKVYKIFGTDYATRKNLDTLYIAAENFDKALSAARKINRCYDGGQPCEEGLQFVINV